MKKLSELYNCNFDIPIKDIKINSKEVEKYDLFVCTKGVNTDRHDFIDEANRQITKLIEKERKNKSIKTEIIITRAKTELQQQNLNIKDEELSQKVNLSEIKEKLDANFVLEFAVQNYILDRNKYEITVDNKIKNLTNNQKPKNAIDFLQRELNLTTRESIEIAIKIYEKANNIEVKNIEKNRKKQKN